MNRPDQAARLLGQAFPTVNSDDPVVFISETGDAAEALKYARLYWPGLVEIHGAVFLALWGHDAADIVERLHRPVADRHPDWDALPWSEAVDSYNRFEVAHLFRQQRGPVDTWEEFDEALADFLVQTWSARLRTAYPDRRFTVRTVEPDGGMDFRIEVVQDSPALLPPAGWDPRRRGIVR
jgi:hypothetical protein